MKVLKNSKALKITAVAVIILALSGVGVNAAVSAAKERAIEAQRIYDEKINKQVNEIESALSTFLEQENYDTQINSLKELKSDLEKYSAGEEKDEKIITAYEESIASAKTSLKESNDKVVANNTQKELEKAKIADLQKNITALTDISAKVEKEKELVYTADEVHKFKTQTSQTIKDYTDQVAKLEKQAKEEAAKKKKEAEEAAKKKKEAEAQAAAEAAYNESITSYAPQDNGYSETTDGGTYTAPNNNNQGGGNTYTPPVNDYVAPPVQQTPPAQSNNNGNIITGGDYTYTDENGNQTTWKEDDLYLNDGTYTPENSPGGGFGFN